MARNPGRTRSRRHDSVDLDRIKREISLETLCQGRGIELKRHGSRDLIGRCPFHDDTEPSFVVTPSKNLFHCMGCGAAGSNIDLVMKLDGVTIKEAIDKLIVKSGLTTRAADLPPPSSPPPEIPEGRAQQLLDRVVSIYEKNLGETTEGKSYLDHRGITDAGLFTTHRVGYCNGTLSTILPGNGTVRGDLRALGILSQADQEHFHGCLVFPVFDVEGRIVTLYGRYTNDGAKRHVFLPHRCTGLWNVTVIKTYSEIILVESVLDALSTMIAGHSNVVAIQGTNGLKDADLALFREHGVNELTLVLDGDEAGKKAAERLKEKIDSSFSCRLRLLPDHHDPNSFLMENGTEALNVFLSGGQGDSTETDRHTGGPVAQGAPASPPPTTAPEGALILTIGLRRYELLGLEKGPRKLKATVRAEHAGKLHVDTLDFYSARSRRILAQDLCRIFDELPETIEGDIGKLLRHCEKHPEKPRSAAPIPGQAESMSPAERKAAEAFGNSPTLFEDILVDCRTHGLMGEGNNVLLLYVAMTSRKRDTPLSVLTLSSSGAGKTALQDAVLAFCPPEDLVKLTALSGKALFYKERFSLKHKVLALEEGDGAQDAMYAIRNLISAGELVSESTIKDLSTGRLTTMENKVEGPSCVCFTTTRPEVDPETKSRFWVTSIDESRDQTRKILAFQRQQHLSDGLITTPQVEALLKKHRNFQRLLKPLAVKNPFAEKLSYGDDRLQGRRDQPKYLNLIKAIAFLRQMQKEVLYEQRNGSAVPYINADPDDIALANRLAHDILGHSLDELSRPGRDLLRHLEEMIAAPIERLKQKDRQDALRPAAVNFTRRDIREFTGWTNTRLHIHLKELADFEYVLIDSGRNGMPYRYRLAYDGQGKDGRKFLLGLTDPARLEAHP